MAASDVAVTILIPTPLRRFTDGAAQVRAEGDTLASALDDLGQRFPGLTERIRDERGELRTFVNVFVNGSNVRDAGGLATALTAGDEVGIIPAMAGG